MEFHLGQNRKKNCHHDPIPFKLKEHGIFFYSPPDFVGDEMSGRAGVAMFPWLVWSGMKKVGFREMKILCLYFRHRGMILIIH